MVVGKDVCLDVTESRAFGIVQLLQCILHHLTVVGVGDGHDGFEGSLDLLYPRWQWGHVQVLMLKGTLVLAVLYIVAVYRTPSG